MIHVHVFLDGKMLRNAHTDHLYRVGDTVRIKDGRDEFKFAKVTEVIWCFDEFSSVGQRVNVRLESEDES